MGPRHAIDVVAKALLGTIDLPEWEDYPEIGEKDWDAVCQRMRELTNYNVREELLEEAHNVLTDRCEKWMRKHAEPAPPKPAEGGEP